MTYCPWQLMVSLLHTTSILRNFSFPEFQTKSNRFPPHFHFLNWPSSFSKTTRARNKSLKLLLQTKYTPQVMLGKMASGISYGYSKVVFSKLYWRKSASSQNPLNGSDLFWFLLKYTETCKMMSQSPLKYFFYLGPSSKRVRLLIHISRGVSGNDFSKNT